MSSTNTTAEQQLSHGAYGLLVRLRQTDPDEQSIDPRYLTTAGDGQTRVRRLLAELRAAGLLRTWRGAPPLGPDGRTRGGARVEWEVTPAAEQ